MQGEVAQFLQYKAGDRRVASSRLTRVAVLSLEEDTFMTSKYWSNIERQKIVPP